MFKNTGAGVDGILGTSDDVTTSTTYLADVMDVVGEIITILTSQPVIYFVMLALVGASIPVVRKLIPRKK